MTHTEQLRIIGEAFDSIPELHDGFFTVAERLFNMNKEAENRHRNGAFSYHTSKLSSINAARLFVVKHLLDGFEKPDRFTVDDILSIRNEVLYAQAYAKRFHKELAPWAANWAKPFEEVDYAELMGSKVA